MFLCGIQSWKLVERDTHSHSEAAFWERPLMRRRAGGDVYLLKDVQRLLTVCRRWRISDSIWNCLMLNFTIQEINIQTRDEIWTTEEDILSYSTRKSDALTPVKSSFICESVPVMKLKVAKPLRSNKQGNKKQQQGSPVYIYQNDFEHCLWLVHHT